MPEYQVPSPEQDIFQRPQRSQVHQVLSEKQHLFVITEIEYSDTGIYIHYQGIPDKYKRKGFPFPEAIAAVNSVKRMTIGFLQIFSQKKFLIPFFNLEQILVVWNRQCEWHLHSIYLKDTLYGNQVRELRRFVETLLVNYGIQQEVAARTALNVATIIEFDDSYRYRVEDIFSIINPEKLLQNPRKEINMVFSEYKRREHSGITDKFGSIVKLLSFGLYIPKVKRAFKKTLKTVDISKIGLDEADSYWTLMRNDYDYQGKTIEKRQQEYNEIHKDGFPQMIVING